MLDIIGRIILIIIGIGILIALAEEYIKKPESRIIYQIVGAIIIVSIIVSRCCHG
jgi:hypothetical protein